MKKKVVNRNRRNGILKRGCVILLTGTMLAGCGASGKAADAYTTGMEAIQNKNYEAAISDFQKAVDDEGRAAEGYRGQGIAYLYLGEYTQAAAMFNQALNSIEYPKQNKSFREDVQFYLAQSYVEAGQLDKAMTIYNELIEGEKQGQAYLLRGKVYASQDKFGQAGQDFQHAIELDDSYEIYLQVYDVYVQNNRQADGATFLKDAQSREAKSADDNYQLGRISYELKDYTRAEGFLTKAADSGIVGALLLLGRVYMDSHDLTSARSLYNRCVEDKDTESIGYNGLALCDMMEGNLDDAIANIEAGLASQDATMKEELMYNEVIVYEMKKDFPTALEKMKAFLAAFPSNETAIRENVFIKSRVQEISQSEVQETEIDYNQVAEEQAAREAQEAAEAARKAAAEEAQANAGKKNTDTSKPATSEDTYEDEDYSEDYYEEDFTDLDGDGIPDDEIYYYDGETTEYTDAYDESDW